MPGLAWDSPVSDDFQNKLDAAYEQYRADVAKLQQGARADAAAIWTDDFTFPDAEARHEELRNMLDRYADRANALGQRYYDTVRTLTEQEYGILLPPQGPIDAASSDRLIWQLAGGSNHTDYPGLHLPDVIPDADGNVHNDYGLRLEDLFPQSDNLNDWLGYIDRWCMSGTRMGIENCVSNDTSNPRWARVPKGKTCEFCIMLASRGYVYWNKETASLGGSFHDGACDCAVVPSWVASKIRGYDPEQLRQRWQACADTVAGLTTKEGYASYVQAFVADGRHSEPLSYSHWKRNIELAEARWRDRTWLNGGPEPPITFATEKLREETERARPQEIRTAQRLRKHGIIPAFQIDSRPVINPDTGIEESVGLPDWAGGVEIKTPDKAKAFRSIDGYLGSAAKKEDCKRLIIDNTENPNMSDDTLIEYIHQSNRFKRGMIYILDKKQSLLRIR